MSCIYEENESENCKRGYEIQIEEPYLGEKLQRTRGLVQHNEQIHIQVRVVKAPTNIQGQYLQLIFIPSLQSDRIPVF